MHSISKIQRMKRVVLLACLSLPGLHEAGAALTLRYDFESITDVNVDPVINLVPGTDGTIINSAKVQLVENTVVQVGSSRYLLGKGLRFTSADGDSGSVAGHVDTGLTPEALGMVNGTETNRPYTAMAWINIGSQIDDNMVFGQNEGQGDNVLHLGARGALYHSGHWGDDVSSVGNTKPNTWHHVAWVNRADNQQEIYEDGVLVGGPGSGGTQTTLSPGNLVIGTSRNPGSYVGALDEIKVFGDVVLTPAEIQAESINGLPIYILATVTEAVLSNTGYRFTIVDDPASIVQTASITLDIDGAPVTPTSVTKTGGVTTVLYSATGLISGSLHPYVLAAKDQTNANITGSGSLRAPYFPTAALPGPSGSPGVWGMREYRNGVGWGTGLDVAVTEAAALPAVDPDPLDGAIVDGTAPVVNHTDPDGVGTGGNFNNDLPFIGDQAGPDDNVMVIAKTQVVIAAAGPVTYSIHSDDGMALRISGGPPAGADSKFISFSGGGAIDLGDPQTLVFPAFTGDSNTRGVYNFTAPGTYDVQFVAFEGTGGTSWELASAPGNFKADRDTNTWTLVGNPNDPAVLAVPFQARWVTDPAGPTGTAGKFGVRTYFSADAVDNLQQASDFVRNTIRTPADGDNLTFDTLRSSLNARDPVSTTAASGTILGDDLLNDDPNAPQGDNDRVVTVAKGRIVVPSDSFYTFWGRGDDGFLLRLKAVSGPNPGFKQATNGDPNQVNGRFEMSNPNELFFEAGTGDANTRGIIFLAAGQYDVEFIHWEGAGGFWYELTAAIGEYPHGTEPPQGWKTVGYEAPVTSIVIPGLAAPGWSVETSLPDTAAGSLGTIAAAEALLDADKTTTTWPLLNFTDPEAGADGSFTPNNPFPRNTGADDNNYAMRATGNLVITEAGEYNLGFQGDDGGYMDISGPGNPVWNSVLESNHPVEAVLTEAVPGSGINNRIQVEVGTGNSRTIANVTLAAGTYTIKTLVFEGGGGSWWEVIGSKAPVATGFNYPLLVEGPGSTVTDPDVLALVAPAAPEAIPVTNFTYNSTTGAYSLTFVSTAGSNYQLEYSTAMEAGAAGTPEKWNIAPGAPTAGAAGTTTINGNISSLQPAGGGVLPVGAARTFLRVRRL